MRIFIAVRVTDDIINNAVKIQKKLHVPDLKVRWIEPYNLHVTLKFIGDVDDDTRGMIENIMQGVFKKTKPFHIGFQGYGVFPNLQSPRVIWAGVGEGAGELKTLAEKINDTLSVLNVRSEQWSFSGHLTLGRIKGGEGVESLIQSLGKLPEDSLGKMEVNSVELMQSKLTAGGPEYKVLKKVQLNG